MMNGGEYFEARGINHGLYSFELKQGNPVTWKAFSLARHLKGTPLNEDTIKG